MRGRRRRATLAGTPMRGGEEAEGGIIRQGGACLRCWLAPAALTNNDQSLQQQQQQRPVAARAQQQQEGPIRHLRRRTLLHKTAGAAETEQPELDGGDAARTIGRWTQGQQPPPLWTTRTTCEGPQNEVSAPAPAAATKTSRQLLLSPGGERRSQHFSSRNNPGASPPPKGPNHPTLKSNVT